jgi:hypothetical protein
MGRVIDSSPRFAGRSPLAQPKEQEILTEEEFQARKKQILDL